MMFPVDHHLKFWQLQGTEDLLSPSFLIVIKELWNLSIFNWMHPFAGVVLVQQVPSEKQTFPSIVSAGTLTCSNQSRSEKQVPIEKP